MSNIDITVTDLTFPANLEDKFCKFRPLISLRYRDPSDQVLFLREAIPGLSKGDYWECELGNKKKPNYVRNEAGHKVDMDKIDSSARTITFSDVHIKNLETVIVEIYDIDITGFWDKLRKELLKILPIAVAPFIPATLPLTLTFIKSAIEQGTGKKVNDLAKGVIDKAMGKEDNSARSIFVRSEPLKSNNSQTLTLKGGGIEGTYSVTLDIVVS
jgi:hypothetical protein